MINSQKEGSIKKKRKNNTAKWKQIKNVVKTALSIRKTKSDSLSEMYLYADYNFDTFLKEGATSDDSFYKYIKLKRSKIFHGNSYASDDMFGCSCFCTKNKQNTTYFGRNFDWEKHPSLIVHTYPKGHYKSISIVDMYYLGCPDGIRMYLPWNIKKLLKAAYLPFDGMNECGVAVAILRVPHAKCEIEKGKVTINSITAVRMILDYCASVEEAIALLSRYNIIFLRNVPLHFFIADSTGKSIVVEFVDGKMEVIESETAWNVVTNFIMDNRYNEGVGVDRFYTANKILKRKKGDIDSNEAMDILHNVKEHTVWSAVYKLNSGKLNVCFDENYEIVNQFSLD